jgi:protein SCO1/2
MTDIATAEESPRGRVRPGTRGAFANAAALAVPLLLVLGVALAARFLRPRPPLPVFGEVPAFHLVDQRGEPYGADTMRGHVTVVDFVFTRCTSSCPRLTARMAELQGRLASARSDVRLVSFSVDPENDTPAVLTRYAASTHADAARWTFVTGPVDDVSAAVVRGFKVSAAKFATGANDYDVTHGDWFVLVDAKGKLRGYYSTVEASDVERLAADAMRLEHER